jgi:hypothetical protein
MYEILQNVRSFVLLIRTQYDQINPYCPNRVDIESF